MAISKLIFNGVIQMDVTGTTAGTGDVASGETFILADGTTGTGSLTPITVNSLSVTQNGTYTAPTGTAYSPVTVTVSGGGGACPWAGPNGTLVQTYNNVSYTLAQTGFATWTPSTTQTQILASQTLGTISIADYLTYDYYIVTEFDFVPVYLAGATLQATPERFVATYVSTRYGYFSTLSDLETGTLNGRGGTTFVNAAAYIYYNNSGAEAMLSGNTNGIYPANNYYPTTSGTTMTVATPIVYAKCHASYFATDRAAELDQTKSKFTIATRVYKTERASGKTYPWERISYIYNNPL